MCECNFRVENSHIQTTQYGKSTTKRFELWESLGCYICWGLHQTNMFSSSWRTRFVGQDISAAVQYLIRICLSHILQPVRFRYCTWPICHFDNNFINCTALIHIIPFFFLVFVWLHCWNHLGTTFVLTFNNHRSFEHFYKRSHAEFYSWVCEKSYIQRVQY